MSRLFRNYPIASVRRQNTGMAQQLDPASAPAPVTDPVTSTRAEAVFRRLRHDILTGFYAPGAKLAFAGLRGRYDASIGVLREALPRLVEQGLVTNEAQLGFRVVTVSPGSLRHLTEARCAIETLVAGQSATAGDLAWESRLVAAHHALSRSGPPGAREQWMARHEAFHAALLAGCPNPYLIESAGRLRAIAEVYRYWSAGEAERVHRDIDGEHSAILGAALAHDAAGCARLLTSHVQRTTDLLLASQATPG
jgi:DNA-binding GntR family transcriptional regulator